MIGGASAVDKNILPASLVLGNRARLRGLNLVGLRRAEFSNQDIRKIELLHKDTKTLELLRKDKNNIRVIEIFDEYLKLQNIKIGTIKK